MGDLYVREEFRLHYKAKPEHLSPFFSQWLDYLDMMKQQQTQLFSSSATTGAAEAKEPAHGEEQVLGRDLEPEQMLMFSEEQMDQLDALRSEAFRIEGKNPDGGK